MARRSLSRWQKAGALVPMAVLVAAWGAALTNTGLANASDTADTSAVPAVPATAFDQPASVQEAPEGIDPRAGADMAVSNLSANGIPAAALSAYRRTETLLARADDSCNLPWTLVAAIGRVESNHGRTDNNTLSADGLAKPGIYGVALDGKDGRARIADTDGGKLDKDTDLDRAVGPMQFIPSTWTAVGVDADGDGTKNPQDIDDAATATGVYLCAGSGNLSKRADAESAVKRYNRSDEYVALVLAIAERYAAGDFTPAPNLYASAPMLTNRSSDQTLTPAQRKKAAQTEKKASAKPKDDDDNSSGSTGSGSTGSTGGGIIPGTGSSGSGGSGSGGGSLGGTVQDLTDDTPLGPVTKPVTKVISFTEATLACGLKYPLGPKSSYDACMDGYGF
jgi:membrane-bound lytic murein transglycosylase B